MIGVDLVHVPGFAAQLAQPGSVFAAGAFTGQELRYCGSTPTRLAARWAAKEAFVKAWPAELDPVAPIPWRDIEVVCDHAGKPHIRLHGAVAAAVEQAGGYDIEVSLTHDGDYAMAVVQISVGS